MFTHTVGHLQGREAISPPNLPRFQEIQHITGPERLLIIMRSYLQLRREHPEMADQSITMVHPKVAQKSYGNEKRFVAFVCPLFLVTIY